MAKILQGCVDDEKTVLTGGFPSTVGNDPNRICRDIHVPGISPRKATTLKTSSKEDIGFFLAKNKPSLKEAGKGIQFEHLAFPETLQWGQPQLGDMGLFFRAVHRAFAAHNPLALSPDLLMYLVLHEVALTVKQNPEKYRPLFSRAKDKQLVRVRHDGLRLGEPSPWHEVVGLFHTAMSERVPSNIMDIMLPSLSTHTVTSQAGSLVAFMDAASPYYGYRVMTRCGIPSIRLLGTPEDYRKVLLSCAELAKLFDKHLGRYFDYLLPVLATIADQAAGAPIKKDFWESIYKYESGSGTDDMTGWLSAFVNYVHTEEGVKAKEICKYDWTELKMWNGIPLAWLPKHLSQTPFVWDYFGVEYPMEFLGGVMAVENVDGYLVPRIGYGVAHL